MLRAYFDDSGTHTDAPVITVGGVIGTDDQWQKFSEMWAALLRNPIDNKRPIKAFSLWDCQNAQNEFRGYSRAESDFLTGQVRQIIKSSGIIGYAAGIDKSAWDELVTADRRQNMGPAETFCLTRCVRDTLKASKIHFGREAEIAIVYDLGRKHRIPSRIENFDWSRGIDGPKVVSFTWDQVAKVWPLQAADMIATESYWFAKERLKNSTAEPRTHFLDYVESAAGSGVFMTRQIIIEELSRRNLDGTVKDAYRSEI
jgi:hypothetical protein